MKKNVKKIITVCLMVLLILVSIYFFHPTVIVERELKNIQVSDKMDDELILPQKLYKLISVYNGNLTVEVISKTYNNFAEKIIPKYYSNCLNLDEGTLLKYFNKNKKNILIELGYENYNDFYKFIKKINNLQGKKLELDNYRLIDESIEANGKKAHAYLAIKYKDNNEIIFNTIISDKMENNKTSITYKTEIDNNIIEKNKKNINNIEEESVYTRGSPIKD